MFSFGQTDTPSLGSDNMKRLVILGALAAVVTVGGFAVQSVAVAGTKESCKHHIVDMGRTTGPARDAMLKRYQACLKAK